MFSLLQAHHGKLSKGICSHCIHKSNKYIQKIHCKLQSWVLKISRFWLADESPLSLSIARLWFNLLSWKTRSFYLLEKQLNKMLDEWNTHAHTNIYFAMHTKFSKLKKKSFLLKAQCDRAFDEFNVTWVFSHHFRQEPTQRITFHCFK